MTVFSHDTRVDILETWPWPDRNPFGNTNYLQKVTQGDGSVEFIVYPSGSDGWAYQTEADARKHFDDCKAHVLELREYEARRP